MPVSRSPTPSRTKMPSGPSVGEFSNFVDAAKAAVDRLQAKNAPFDSTENRPRYCKSATYTLYPGGRILWATLWRQWPVKKGEKKKSMECSDELVNELKELAERGPDAGVKEINGVKWMFETLDKMPKLNRRNNFRQGSLSR